MFENIIGQDKVINLLKSDIINKALSNSMIFHGKTSVGKLTTAFELARLLNCKGNNLKSCICENCIKINDLNFEGLIFLSRRNFLNQLNELILSYNIYKSQALLNAINRIIKLISLPLQDFLIKDIFNESEKNTIYESLENLYNISSRKNDNSILDVEKINSLVNNIQFKYKKLNLPIDSIRAMLDWTYIAQPDINRVVIIDHADHLEKSSQNVLLKRLEEPTPNLFFILIAENKNKIVQTIVSRCRIYYFLELSKDNCKKIIQNSFEANGDYNSINEFLSKNDEASKINLFPVIIKLLNLTFLKDAPFAELNIFLNAYNDKKLVKSMLYELSVLLQKEVFLRESGLKEESDLKMLNNISDINLIYLNDLIKKKYNQIDQYGLNSILLLEGLFYPIKAMVQNDQF